MSLLARSAGNVSVPLSFKLPVNVQSDKVDASFDKGVLKITLPKTEEAKKSEITIKVK